MQLELFSIWKTSYSFGIGFLSSTPEVVIDDEEEEFTYALFGLSYIPEERTICIDLFWTFFEIPLKRTI